MSDAVHRSPAMPCDACLRRSWLVARLSAHIELAWSARRGSSSLLALGDDGADRRARPDSDADAIVAEHERFDDGVAAPSLRRERGVAPLCRCDRALSGSAARPARRAGGALRPRRAGALSSAQWPPTASRSSARDARTPYGLEQARGLGRGLAAAGLTVVSGMALGVDAAAHVGALEVGGRTLAVLACGPEIAYPASKRRLHRAHRATGAVVAELPPGTPPRRWCFPARNRIIAALAQATVVVEAGERSGSLITAGQAADLGREVAAVPGLVTAPLAAGTNALIADGAQLVRGPRDVLELLFGAGRGRASGAPADDRAAGLDARPAHAARARRRRLRHGRRARGRGTRTSTRCSPGSRSSSCAASCGGGPVGATSRPPEPRVGRRSAGFAARLGAPACAAERPVARRPPWRPARRPDTL